MLVHWVRRRSQVRSENFLHTGPNLCLILSGAVHWHDSCRLFFCCKTVLMPRQVSMETTTVFPRLLPRPSSPCHASGTTDCKLPGCSLKTLWSPWCSLKPSQKACRCSDLSCWFWTPPTNKAGYSNRRKVSRSVGAM